MNAASPALVRKSLYAGMIPPLADYVTEALIFPGINARDPWPTKGSFRFVCRVMSGGKEIARSEPQSCDQKGHVTINLDKVMKGVTEPGPSFTIVEMERSEDIPVSFYFAHIHRKTGIYYPSPALGVMGDTIYQEAHATQLENTLFWPGIPNTSNTEFRLAVINPYEAPMSIEATGWHNTLGRCTSGVRRVSPGQCVWLPLADWMPASWLEAGESASICVAAQFKLVAFMAMVNRTTGIITSADHLHAYHLY
ncbi:MAG: hypothetical protein JWO94_829 [Verrucomicrobiaceae bacterium]|nr:hypothetical protein [Verrucomicrobiaceae bacterium]